MKTLHDVAVGDTMYRYADRHGTLCADVGKVIKVTPCGAYVSDYPHAIGKFVLLCDSRGHATFRRYWHATPEKAWESFRARKERQVKILTRQLAAARVALARTSGYIPIAGTYTVLEDTEQEGLGALF